MVNPLTAFGLARRRDRLRRKPVPVPTEVGSTDAIFLVLRRMRAPLLWLVTVFSISVVGLHATPGVDADGAPYRMSMFESFYVMSYTATTIGFGEVPYEFTTGQRLWVTLMFYATVIGWAFALGTLLALVQDEGFTTALAMQRFGRRVRRIAEPFYIVAGYGETGRSVCRRLDAMGRRFVVVDETRGRIDLLQGSDASVEVPSLTADVHDPAVLGLAGLGHAECVGVLALTDDDEVNLAVVQTVALLQPEVPVIARVSDQDVERQMWDFAPAAVVNPVERFGNYLVLSLQAPAVYQLLVWLTSPRGGEMPERGPQVADGRWTVCAEGQFRDCVAEDLHGAGFDVRFADPDDLDPDVSDVVGCVVATMQDSTNLAIAGHIRREHPDVKLCVRQVHISARPVMTAFDPHMLFIPTDLVARETLARVVAPGVWAFIEHALEQDDAWGARTVELLRSRCGDRTPTPSTLRLVPSEAPAVTAWLEHHELTVGDLTRDFEDRDQQVAVVVATVTRDNAVLHLPEADLRLEPGDELLLFSARAGLGRLREVLFNDASVEYAATGRRLPATWIWRQLSRRPVG